MSVWDGTAAESWGGRPVIRRVGDAAPRHRLVATGVIRGAGSRVVGSGQAHVCTLEDDSGTIDLVFVGRRWVPGLQDGARCTVEGTVARSGGRLVLWSPLYRLERAPAVLEQPALLEPAGAAPASRKAAAGTALMGRAVTAESDAADTVEAAGHFRIYLGSAAGVGKTFAMLNEGQRRRERGTDVVVAFVETHRRPLTEERLAGLEIVPRIVVEHRGATFTEMDLAAVLARRPAVALVDELAHTNVPGSGPHARRWEDVLDILAAGIDVITTVNVQHLESLADAVEQMTGTKVRERVPDWVVRKADQIELVDSSPEQLRRRILHGNVYPPAKVAQALNNFFRRDNLIALRELALRFLADETDEELLEHLRRNRPGVVWETTERIMVAVTTAPGTDVLLRRAARIAARSKAELDVLHVRTGDDVRTGEADALERLQGLTVDLGARWHQTDDTDPALALIEFAREHQITQIVIGSSQRSRWQELTGGGSIVRRVIRSAGAVGIDVHVIARREMLAPAAAEAPT